MSEKQSDQTCLFILDQTETPDDVDEYSCNRVRWNDSAYCIWHADVSDKPISELKNHRSDTGERLDGAIINDIDFSDEISFTDCSLINAQAENSKFKGIHQRVDFRGADLTNTVFKNSGLDRCDLSQSIIKNADFSNSSLVNADFTGATTDYTDFSNANLRKAKLCELDLTNCKLVGSILREIDFTGSEAKNQKLSDLNISDATFVDSNLSNSDFSNSNLSHIDFSNAVIENADFTGVNASSSCFSESSISRSDCSNADFEGSEFNNTDFTDAKASDSNFKDIRAKNATFKRTDFSKSNFKRANLSGTHLDDADLQDTNMQSAILSSGVLSFADLTKCDARSALFKKTDLENTNLTQADLRDADLQQSLLYQVILTDARVNDTTDFGTSCRYETDSDTSIRFDDSTHRLEAAAWTYRRLNDLYSTNSMADQSYRYHYKKEEAKRSYYRKKRNYIKYTISTLNRWLTRHGEGLSNIITASILVIVLGAVFYPFLGGIRGENGVIYSLEPCICIGSNIFDVLLNNLYFSLSTFSAIGSNSHAPVGLVTKYFASIQSLFGTLLTALFIFTLGRRVNR